MELDPEKECSTCSALCMRVDTIAETVKEHDKKLNDLQSKLLSMEVRITTIISIVVFASTIIADKFFK